MNCKHCGSILEQDAVFCSTCGKRADGKKECPNCHKQIDDSAIFCKYCGARLDGKINCPNCDAVLTENAQFCDKCGTSIEQENKKIALYEKPKSLFGKIERILSPSLLLGALVCLLICAFFIGVSATVKYDGERVSESTNTLDYFGALFKDLNVKDGPKTFFAYWIFVLIALAGNAVVILSMLITTLVKFVVGIQNDKAIKVSKYSVIAYATFIVTAFFTASLFQISNISLSGVDVTLRLSAGAIIGLVISGLLIFSVLILGAIARGKKVFDARNVISFVTILVTITFVIVCYAIMAKNFISLTTEYQTSEKISIKLPLGPVALLEYSIDELFFVLGFIGTILLLVMPYALVTTASAIEKNKTPFLTILWSGLAFIGGAFLMVGSIVACNEIANELTTQESVSPAGPIVIFALSTIFFIYNIVMTCIQYKRKNAN